MGQKTGRPELLALLRRRGAEVGQWVSQHGGVDGALREAARIGAVVTNAAYGALLAAERAASEPKRQGCGPTQPSEGSISGAHLGEAAQESAEGPGVPRESVALEDGERDEGAGGKEGCVDHEEVSPDVEAVLAKDARPEPRRRRVGRNKDATDDSR